MNPMTRSNRVGDLGGGQGAASEELGIWNSEVSSLARPFDSTQASCGSISIFSFEIFRSGAPSDAQFLRTPSGAEDASLTVDAFLSLELGSVTAVTRPLIPDFPGNNELKQRVHPEISDSGDRR